MATTQEEEDLEERRGSSVFDGFVERDELHAMWGIDRNGVEWRWYRFYGWDHAFVGPVREFVVDRKTWIRGLIDRENPITGSYLLREDDGHRCCLGFLGRHCGVPDAEMLGVSSPSGTSTRGDGWFMWPARILAEREKTRREQSWLAALTLNSDETTTVMQVNDDGGPSSEEHEEMVRDTLSYFGLRPIFI